MSGADRERRGAAMSGADRERRGAAMSGADRRGQGRSDERSRPRTRGAAMSGADQPTRPASEPTMRGRGRRAEALLVLADGTTFEGEAAGWWDPERPVPAVGEVVFNTTLTGYQEVLTDPSYAGQIVCFTYPHIGNYGITAADNESRRAFCRGLIVRELAPRPSSWRSQRSLADFLVEQRLPGTRRDRHPPADPPHPRRRRHAGGVRPGERPGRPGRAAHHRRGGPVRARAPTASTWPPR